MGGGGCVGCDVAGPLWGVQVLPAPGWWGDKGSRVGAGGWVWLRGRGFRR